MKKIKTEAKRREYLKKVHNAHKATGLKLIEAVKAEYPVGTIIQAKLGKAVITATVTGYCEYWFYEPGVLYVHNLKTGRSRVVNPLCEAHDVQIVEHFPADPDLR